MVALPLARLQLAARPRLRSPLATPAVLAVSAVMGVTAELLHIVQPLPPLWHPTTRVVGSRLLREVREHGGEDGAAGGGRVRVTHPGERGNRAQEVGVGVGRVP